MKHIANCFFLGGAIATAFVAGVLCGRGASDCIPMALVICGAFVIGLAINNYPIGDRHTAETERRWKPGAVGYGEFRLRRHSMTLPDISILILFPLCAVLVMFLGSAAVGLAVLADVPATVPRRLRLRLRLRAALGGLAVRWACRRHKHSVTIHRRDFGYELDCPCGWNQTAYDPEEAVQMAMEHATELRVEDRV